MTESNTKKSLKKNSDGPKTLGYHFNYALMLALVSLALSALALGSLYFIFFVEIKDLKSELNSKLNKNTFLSEREKIISSSIEELQSEKEFLLSRFNMVNDLVKKNAEDIESKISAAISENIIHKTKDDAQNQSEMKNNRVEINDATDPGIFKIDYEKNLYKKINEIKKYYLSLNNDENYEQSLSILAGAKNEIFEFFDNVKVNEENETLRKNRLELINMLCKTFQNFINFHLLKTNYE